MRVTLVASSGELVEMGRLGAHDAYDLLSDECSVPATIWCNAGPAVEQIAQVEAQFRSLWKPKGSKRSLRPQTQRR